MLIKSERHTKRDLECWRELEYADSLHAQRSSLSRRIMESENVIAEFKSRASYAGVSWGKDSIVLAHLLFRNAPEVPLVRLRPTNSNPDCDSVRDAYFESFPGQHYSEVNVDYSDLHAQGLDDSTLDKETDRIWFASWKQVSMTFGPCYFSGIRSSESNVRLLRFLRWGEATEKTCAPLSRWTTADVFAYMQVNNLPVHPAYACLGGGRWPRERLRVAEIGDTHGKGGGRSEWEREYYGDSLRRIS